MVQIKNNSPFFNIVPFCFAVHVNHFLTIAWVPVRKKPFVLDSQPLVHCIQHLCVSWESFTSKMLFLRTRQMKVIWGQIWKIRSIWQYFKKQHFWNSFGHLQCMCTSYLEYVCSIVAILTCLTCRLDMLGLLHSDSNAIGF